jgi:predicted metal-dependent HD superfamily phosphohydrolase
MDIPVESLKSRYREPWRRYHTLQHIGELLELLKANAAGLESPRAVELAIWYHDVVYDPLAAKGDNERASDALFAADWHACGGEPDDPLRRLVSAMIIATVDHDMTREHAPDVALFLDFDMSILGARQARYQEYAGQVRAEYAAVPEDRYRAGRAAFLRGALDKPVLYYTDAFQGLCDAAARRNMAWELDQLRG